MMGNTVVFVEQTNPICYHSRSYMGFSRFVCLDFPGLIDCREWYLALLSCDEGWNSMRDSSTSMLFFLHFFLLTHSLSLGLALCAHQVWLIVRVFPWLPYIIFQFIEMALPQEMNLNCVVFWRILMWYISHYNWEKILILVNCFWLNMKC